MHQPLVDLHFYIRDEGEKKKELPPSRETRACMKHLFRSCRFHMISNPMADYTCIKIPLKYIFAVNNRVVGNF